MAPAREPSPTDGMIEIRHLPGTTRMAYDGLYRRRFRNLIGYQAWLLRRLGAGAGMRLLDIACGRGNFLPEASRAGLTAVGVDQSRVALTAAQRQAPGVDLVQADGEELPFPDEFFDVVTNMGGLVHYVDPVSGAKEMARVLRPDGRAAVLLPNAFGLRLTVLNAWRTGALVEDGQPLQRFGTRRQWARLLEACGLDVESVVGHEARDDWPRRVRDWPQLVRHPSRLLIPFADRLPANIASQLIFLCRKA